MALSRKMAVDTLQLYFESHCATKALRTMGRRYPNDTEIRRLSARQLYRLVARFKETGSVADKRHDNVGRPRSSRSSENVQEVKRIIDETPEKSKTVFSARLETFLPFILNLKLSSANIFGLEE